MQKLISILTIIFVASCSLAPEYERANNPAGELKSFKNPAVENGKESISRWWTRLDDPLSEKLVDVLLDQNFDIEASYARLRQNIENSRIAGADLYPTLSGDFSASRSKSAPLSQSFGTGKPLNSFDLGLATSWQLDFFGKNRSNIASKRADLEASILETNALIQSLISQTIGQRITIAINAHKLALVKNTISNRGKTLDIVERRYRSGINETSALDLHLARENLAAAKAELASAESALEESIYELDLLLGQNIGKSANIDFAKISLMPPPQNIKISPPAALLDSRPDLQASELRAVAANANIGVAIADLYPDLSISANFGTNARKASELLNSSQIGWSLIGSISQKIFAGGKLRANIRLSEARADELIANYKQKILTAIKEVETALLRENKLHKQVTALGKNLIAVKQAERVASDRYTKGIGDVIQVMDTQRRLWQTAQNVLNAQNALWQNRLALYLSLGGDWNFKKEEASK